MVLLGEIADAEQRQRAEDHDRDQQQFPYLCIVIEHADREQQSGDDGADRQHDEAWRERKQQRFHDIPQPAPISREPSAGLCRIVLGGKSLIPLFEYVLYDYTTRSGSQL